MSEYPDTRIPVIFSFEVRCVFRNDSVLLDKYRAGVKWWFHPSRGAFIQLFYTPLNSTVVCCPGTRVSGYPHYTRVCAERKGGRRRVRVVPLKKVRVHVWPGYPTEYNPTLLYCILYCYCCCACFLAGDITRH